MSFEVKAAWRLADHQSQGSVQERTPPPPLSRKLCEASYTVGSKPHAPPIPTPREPRKPCFRSKPCTPHQIKSTLNPKPLTLKGNSTRKSLSSQPSESRLEPAHRIEKATCAFLFGSFSRPLEKSRCTWDFKATA